MVYQDNFSTMRLENNGRGSSGKKTRHIKVRYFFVTDRIAKGDMRVEHCPTDMLIADYYSKPLQGKKFKIFRNSTLNLNETRTHEHKTQSNNVHKGKKKTVPKSTHNSIMCSSQECVEQNVNKGIMKKKSVRTYSNVCNKFA